MCSNNTLIAASTWRKISADDQSIIFFFIQLNKNRIFESWLKFYIVLPFFKFLVMALNSLLEGKKNLLSAAAMSPLIDFKGICFRESRKEIIF